MMKHNIEQLDLFEDDEQTRFRIEMGRSIQELSKQVDSCKNSSDKVRRGLFARFDQLANDYADLLKLVLDIRTKLDL